MGYGLLALQSGELIIQFDEATGYGSNTPEDDTLHVTIEGKEDTTITKIPVRQYLRDPLTYRNTTANAQCHETEFYYADHTVSHDLLLGREETESKMAYVEDYTPAYGDNYDDVNYGGSNDELWITKNLRTINRDVNGDGESEEVDQLVERNSFLQFAIKGYETNGTFSKAIFEFNQVPKFSSFDSIQTFSVNKVTDSWTEQSITWNNQPGSTNSLLQSDEDRGAYISNEIGAAFSVNITEYAESWLSDPSTNHGIALKSKEEGSYGQFVSPATTSISDGVFAWPRLTLYFTNPNPVPSATEVSIGHVEAGDIIKLDYTGVTNDTEPINKDHDFFPLPSQEEQPNSIASLASTTTSMSQGLDTGTSLNFYQEDGACGEHSLDYELNFQQDNDQDSLWISPNPDSSSVAPGDTVIFNPLLNFSNGRTLSFPNLQVYEVNLTGGKNFGTLFADLEPDTTDFLEEVNKGFGFIAKDSLNLDSTLVSNVKVRTLFGFTRDVGGGIIIRSGPTLESQQDLSSAFVPPSIFGPDEIFNGNSQVFINKDSVIFSINIPGPNKIWPTLRDRDGGNDGDRNKKENIIVSLSRSGEPVSNQTVSINVTRVEGSGGHDHELEGEKLPQDRLGIFTYQGEESFASLEAETNQGGKIEFDYTGSNVSGKYILKAATQIDGKLLFARDTLVVRVPGLKELTSGPSYELVGAPDNHSGTNDPCRVPPASQHYSNHWGVSDLNNAVKQIAADYVSFHPGAKLRINDMSLKWGGLFDFKNNWNPPHNSHRTGTNADIGFKEIDSDGGCKRDINLKTLRRIIIKSTGKIPLKETGHYHIYSN